MFATKHDVIDLHRKHPDWSSTQIASAILGERAADYQQLVRTRGYVRATGVRNSLKFPRKPPKPRPDRRPRQDGIQKLGRACREAGLTLADIRDIADTINA